MNNPKNVFYLMLGVLVLMIAGSAGGAYYTHGLLSDRSAEIDILKAEEEIAQQKVAIARQAKDDLEKYAYVEQLTDAVIPPEKQQSEIILEIEQIAQTAGINFDAVNFESSGGLPSGITQTEKLEGVSGVLTLPITTSIVAPNFDSMLTFLQGVENNRRKIQFTDLSISRITEPEPVEGEVISPPNDGQPNYSLSFTITVFLRTN